MADLLLTPLCEGEWEGRKINSDFRPMVWLANQYLRGTPDKDPFLFSQEAFNKVDLDKLDAQGIMAILVGLMRAERFCEGIFLDNLKSGFIFKCIQRLEIISKARE